MKTTDIIRALDVIYEELKEGHALNAARSLEILIDDLNGHNPRVSDLSWFRELAQDLKPEVL